MSEKMNILSEDTIAAVATAPGEGGIGIVRISGQDALKILERIFVRESAEIKPRQMTYGYIIDGEKEKVVDEVLAVYMKGPHSYTAEDVVEIQCHGGTVSLKNILRLALKNGARLAERGEFTKRAFLNGRLDLSQAEAVADLVKAKTDRSFDIAMGHLEGVFSSGIRELREKLSDVLMNVTVNIDYPDEDIEELTYDKLLADMSAIKEELSHLLATAEKGRIFSEGLKISIVGRPNVGKSSLMNALAGEERAIVTDIPGTTRDTIEQSVSVRGIPVVLTDTAGIHETDDYIEKIGIERSKDAFNRADLLIMIIDGSASLTQEDRELLQRLAGRKAIVLLNKRDLGSVVSRGQIEAELAGARVIETSITSGGGLDLLAEAIEELVAGGGISPDSSMMITSLRQAELVRQALGAAEDACAGIESRQPLELIEIDASRAYQLLGEVLGEEVVPDILDKVFANFCLGK